MNIQVKSMCDGLGHWQVTVGEVTLLLNWVDLQAPLEPEEIAQLAQLVLRTKCAGISIDQLGDLLLNGVVV